MLWVGDTEGKDPRINSKFRVVQTLQGNMETEVPHHLPLSFSSLLEESTNTPARSGVRNAVLYWN